MFVARAGALALCAMLATGCASLMPRPRPPSPADSALARAILQQSLSEYWRDALTRSSDAALANGLRASTLPDLSQASRKTDLQLAQRIGSALDVINVGALTEAEYMTTLALRWKVDAQAEKASFYLTDFSLLSPTTTPVRELTDVFRLHPITSASDAERFLYFVEAFPFVLERIRSGLEERRERGYVAPREMVESALGFYRGLQALGAKGPWSLDSARASVLDSTARESFVGEAALLAKLRIAPALDSLIEYLDQSYLPEASERPGLWQYPGGKELYRHLLRQHSSLDVPPDEAHRVGLGELRRIDSTMAALRRRQHWNPNPVAFNDSLRRVTAPAPSLDAVIASIATREQALESHLTDEFQRLPPRRAIVRAATPAEAVLWPNGGYIPPTGIDSLGALLLTDRWRQPATIIPLAARTFRALLPGHHLAASLIYDDTTIAPLRRQMETPGFSDGWSQYAASLAGEMGMYDDPLDAYGRLLDEGAAMALLVVDTGIHYLGWSLSQGRAVLGRYMIAGDDEVERTLVERVVNDPGRGGAGALGAREFAAMRGWMHGELGRDFDVRRWHAEMLSLGSIPLPLVGTHLEWWLYDQRRRAAEAARAAAAAANAVKAIKVPPKKPRPTPRSGS